MKISTNLPFASRINSIPGGRYTVLAAVGVLALVVAIYLKSKWDNAALDAFMKKNGLRDDVVTKSYQDQKLRKLYNNIFAATRESPENRMASIRILNSAQEGKVLFGPGPDPFAKITPQGLFTSDTQTVSNFVPSTANQTRCIGETFFWVEEMDLKTEKMTFPAGDEIVSFDDDGVGRVAIATKKSVIGYVYTENNTVRKAYEFTGIKGDVVSVQIHNRIPIIVTAENGHIEILSYDADSYKHQVLAQKDFPILSAKKIGPLVVIDCSEKLEFFNCVSGKWLEPISKSFKGASLFTIARGFVFIAPKEGTEIYLCDHRGSVLSTLQVPEKIQNLRFEDNKLYAVGETQGFVWDFNK